MKKTGGKRVGAGRPKNKETTKKLGIRVPERMFDDVVKLIHEYIQKKQDE